MDEQTAGVGPVDGSVRPAVYAKTEDLAQVKSCNGVGVWCENPSIYGADCRPPPSLVPLFDLDELWRVAARAAEIESAKVQAAVAAERERFLPLLRECETLLSDMTGPHWPARVEVLRRVQAALRPNAPR